MRLKAGKTLCALLASASLMSAVSAQTLPLANEELDVGLSPVAPFVMIDGEFTDLAGIDVDIIRELQRRTGFKLKHNRFHIMGFGELLDLAAAGKMDISAAAISISEKRAQLFLQSPASFRSHAVVVVPADSNVDDYTDLVGKTIAAEAGTDATDIVSPEIADKVKIKHENTAFMTFYSVAHQNSDALITEAPMAMEAAEDWAKGKLKIAYHIKGSENDMGLMFKKGTYTSQVLYQTFEQMREDGTIEQIVHKYLPSYEFPEDLKPGAIAKAKAQIGRAHV